MANGRVLVLFATYEPTLEIKLAVNAAVFVLMLLDLAAMIFARQLLNLIGWGPWVTALANDNISPDRNAERFNFQLRFARSRHRRASHFRSSGTPNAPSAAA